jgi:hypothetical protein
VRWSRVTGNDAARTRQLDLGSGLVNPPHRGVAQDPIPKLSREFVDDEPAAASNAAFEDTALHGEEPLGAPRAGDQEEVVQQRDVLRRRAQGAADHDIERRAGALAEDIAVEPARHRLCVPGCCLGGCPRRSGRHVGRHQVKLDNDGGDLGEV